MKVQISQASDLQIDWLVATLEGIEVDVMTAQKQHPLEFLADKTPDQIAFLWSRPTYLIGNRKTTPFRIRYSTDPAQSYTIIFREQIWTRTTDEGQDDPSCLWRAEIPFKSVEVGPTPMSAAMRCFVSSRLGSEAEVPVELAEFA